MKTIIALRGPGDSGKSTTLELLNFMLLQNGYQLISSQMNEVGRDEIAVFSKNEKLIGVTIHGDNYNILQKCLQELVYSNCTICVCTCRTVDRAKQGTHAAIREFTNYSNQFVNKTVGSDSTTFHDINRADARKLLSIINRSLIALPGSQAPVLNVQKPTSQMARQNRL